MSPAGAAWWREYSCDETKLLALDVVQPVTQETTLPIMYLHVYCQADTK